MRTTKVGRFLVDSIKKFPILFLLSGSTLVTDVTLGRNRHRIRRHCDSQVNENKKRPESVAYNKELAKSAP